jgi:hypothetical protein
MISNEYHFVTHWRVKAPVEEVFDIISNPTDLTRWWPSVYLDVDELKRGDKKGLGKIVALHTKGWLPYTLRWQFRIVESDAPRSFTLEAWGDFVGRGTWSLERDGDWTNVTYDWRIRAEKPLLRRLSPILKPFFAANHRWAMARGEESLRLELERRQAKTPRQRALIPFPPSPNRSSTLWLLAGSAAVVGGLYFLKRSRTRPRAQAHEE